MNGGHGAPPDDRSGAKPSLCECARCEDKGDCRNCEEAAYLRAYAASLAPLSRDFPYPITGAPWE